MDVEALRTSPIGELVRIRGNDARAGDYDYFAYVPSPLPDKPILDHAAWNAVAGASEALGRLRQACAPLPNPRLLITPALAREAVDTSALEGTYGALPDVLEARLPQLQPKSREVAEIRAYERMAQQAFEWVEDRPITIGMLSDLQGILAQESRTPPRDPGRVREHQVLIGPEGCTVYDARFVPPPPGDHLIAGLDAWREWIHRSDLELPPPLRAALAHYQFETLHPFGDGNGRVGRLVIVLQLLSEGVITEPALTVSPWFLKRRSEYQDHLLRVSATGDWSPWVAFFCSAIREQCEGLVRVAEQLTEWMGLVRLELHRRGWFGTIHRLAEDLIDWPVITMTFASEKYGTSLPTAKHAVDRLVEIGVLTEMTGKKYARVYGAMAVIELVESL